MDDQMISPRSWGPWLLGMDAGTPSGCDVARVSAVIHSAISGYLTHHLKFSVSAYPQPLNWNPANLTWRRQWQPTPALLPGKSHGQRSLVGCSPWGRQESDTTERLDFHFHFHALEKEMATHSSVLAWRIPGMGEPGGLSSLVSHRVGHD